MSKLVKTHEITEQEIMRIRDMDALEAADIYDARVRTLERQTRRAFVEVGLICCEMRDRQLWMRLTEPGSCYFFTSFHAWLRSAAGVSRSGAYAAMRTLEDLRGLPMDDLRAMPRCNAVTLASLSTGVKTAPALIEAAKTLSEDDFVAKVGELYPDQHLEVRRKILASPTASARAVIDRAITLCMELEGVTKDDALEVICVDYLEYHQADEYVHDDGTAVSG